MENRQRIKAQRLGKLTDEDKYTICALLVKAGYAVRIGRENVGTVTKPKYEHFIEFWEESK